MHRRHRRIGEGLPGQAGAQQHGLARLAVAAVAYRAFQVGRQQAQRLPRQQVGQRVLLQFAGIALDRMHHRVDTGRRGDRRRQAEGQVGVEQRQVGQQVGRDHAHLGGLAGGDDGDRRHLGAGPGGGRHLDQRQARPACVADPEDLAEPLPCFWVGEQRDQLGYVHGAAAAETDHQLGSHAPRPPERGLDHRLGRIGEHLVVHLDGQAQAREAGQDRIQQAEPGDPRVGHDQHAARPSLAAEFRQADGGAGLAEDLRGSGETESLHIGLLGRDARQNEKCSSGRAIRQSAPPSKASRCMLARGRIRRR